MSESNLVGITACGCRKGWVRSGWPEKIEKSRRGDKSYRGGGITVGRSKTLAERCQGQSGRYHCAAARIHAGIGSTRGDDDRARILDAEARSCYVEGILIQQLRIGGIDVYRAIQIRTASVLVANADGPEGAGELTFDGQVPLLRVTIFEIRRHGQCEGENR